MNAGDHVLVVDDDREIRLTIVEILEEYGYVVATASDGDDAIEQMRQRRPALVLLDLNMPRMSGQEVRRVQRADPELASIPTIVVSAADRLAERMEELMPSAFLAKPLQLKDLLRLVEHFCGAPAR